MKCFKLFLVIGFISFIASCAPVYVPSQQPVNSPQPQQPVYNTQTNNYNTTDGSFRAYTNSVLRFTIGFPGDWEIREDNPSLIVSAQSPLDSSYDNYRENINIANEVLNQPFTLEQYFSYSVSSLQAVLNNFVLLEQGDVYINGLPMKWLVYTAYAPQLGITIKSIMYIFINNGLGYAIGCASTIDKFEQYRSLYTQILNTFRFF